MLENSADPDKVPHFVTPYLGYTIFHCIHLCFFNMLSIPKSPDHELKHVKKDKIHLPKKHILMLISF